MRTEANCRWALKGQSGLIKACGEVKNALGTNFNSWANSLIGASAISNTERWQDGVSIVARSGANGTGTIIGTAGSTSTSRSGATVTAECDIALTSTTKPLSITATWDGVVRAVAALSITQDVSAGDTLEVEWTWTCSWSAPGADEDLRVSRVYSGAGDSTGEASLLSSTHLAGAAGWLVGLLYAGGSTVNWDAVLRLYKIRSTSPNRDNRLGPWQIEKTGSDVAVAATASSTGLSWAATVPGNSASGVDRYRWWRLVVGARPVAAGRYRNSSIPASGSNAAVSFTLGASS